jgi:hypothetical protein
LLLSGSRSASPHPPNTLPASRKEEEKDNLRLLVSLGEHGLAGLLEVLEAGRSKALHGEARDSS